METTTKLSKINNVKAEIIIHCLDYLDNKDLFESKQAINKLIEFASFYRVSLRRKDKTSNVKLHLRHFILNKQGYNETITPLYNSLTNG